MSKRADSFLADFLGTRWTATHAPAGGTTLAAATPATASLKYRNVIDALSFGITNKTAAAATVVATMRDLSVGGTVLMTWNFLIAAAGRNSVDLGGMGVPCQRGKQIFVTQDTVHASIIATANMSGWTDTDSSY